MNLEKWLNRHKTDCALKYNSFFTKENYTSGVKSFLVKFNSYSEPKEIPNIEIKDEHGNKLSLLTFTGK